MKTVSAVAFALVSFALTAAVPAPKGATNHFGAAPKITTEPLRLADATKPENLGHAVLVKAPTEAVCQKKGCWLTLAEGDSKVRVTFQDYGFFVPKELAGKTVLVEGTLKAETVAEKDARHFAKDAGKSSDEIKKIQGDHQEITMVATSVTIAE